MLVLWNIIRGVSAINASSLLTFLAKVIATRTPSKEHSKRDSEGGSMSLRRTLLRFLVGRGSLVSKHAIGL